MEPRELEPVNGDHLPNGYSDTVRVRALSLVAQSRSVASAYRALKVELEAKGQMAPGYVTVFEWSRDSGVISEGSEARKEIEALSGDVARDYAEAMIEARPHLSHSQIPVPYGISMQRYTDWMSAGHKGNQLNVQFNLVGHDGRSIKQGDGGA